MKNVIKISKKVLLLVIMNAILSTGAVMTYHHYYAQKIVAIDLNGYKERLEHRLEAEQWSEADIEESLQDLDSLIKSQPENTILVLSDVVVNKTVDILKP